MPEVDYSAENFTDEKIGFEMPFQTQDQLALVGAFAVVWGNIDFMVVHSIAKLLDCSPFACETLTDGMTTAPRVSLLGRLAKNAPTEDLKRRITSFAKDMSPLIDLRNRILHGNWALYTDDANKTSIAALHARHRENPIFLEKRPENVQKIGKQSIAINSIFRDLHGFPRRQTVAYQFDTKDSIPRMIELGEVPDGRPPRKPTSL